jgi:hypothetical protein
VKAQNICLYTGAAFFLMHMLSVKLKITPTAIWFMAVPYVGSLVIKWGGYFWVDKQIEKAGLYFHYGIH